MNREQMARFLYEQDGILNLIPIFLPRQFCKPGYRLRLHPDDYYAFGMERGAIKERWFSSVICAMNGEKAKPDEGLSYVNVDDNTENKVSLKDFVDTLGAVLIGQDLYDKYGTWPMYAKFFDYADPLFHHLHLSFEDAERVGKLGKPEAYYYSPQMNNYPGSFPHTYYGFAPEVTKEEVRERLLHFTERDDRITELSRAYRIQLGTGWYTAPGVVHAPGSYLTYEPQWNSDVNAVFENVVCGEVFGKKLLVENLPKEEQDDVDRVMNLLDWEKNVDPDYRKHYFRPPVTLQEDENHIEKQVVYGNPYISAKELTVLPGKTVTVYDDGAYGCILVQGYGRMQGHKAASATMLRFGQISRDEFFVSADRARAGVTIENHSDCEPLVMLKHYPSREAEQEIRV